MQSGTRSISLLRLLAVLFLSGALSGAGPLGLSPAQQESLRAVRTLLIAGEISTWLDVPEPPYNVAVTIKMKLEQAGFRVTFDPSASYDAVLLLRYRETPGREYPRLERGTNILCEIGFQHSTMDPVLLYRFETGTSWPAPIGSLYWDAIRNLEEIPYYYYLGELLKGWLTAQADSVTVLSEVLRQPPLSSSSTEGSGFQASGQVVANEQARINAINVLARSQSPQAIETLWMLIDRPSGREREAAVRAIGNIGDPEAIGRLTRLYEQESDPDMRVAINAAIDRIRAKMERPQ